MNKALKKYRKVPYRLTKYGKARLKRVLAMTQAHTIAVTANAMIQAIRTMNVDGSSITNFHKKHAIADVSIRSMGAIKNVLTINKNKGMK